MEKDNVIHLPGSKKRTNVTPMNPTTGAILQLQEELIEMSRFMNKLIQLLKRNDTEINAQLEALHRRIKTLEERLCSK